MKRKVYLLSIIAAFFIPQLIFAQQADNKPYYHRRGSSADITGANTNPDLLPNSTGQSGTGTNMDVVYHRIWWRINPDSAKGIKGSVTTYFKTTQANVSSITFDLRQSAFNNINLVATYHGAVCTRSISGTNVLSITLPSTIAASGTLDSIVVDYNGAPPGIVGAAEGYQIMTDGTSGQKYIYTLSESYEDRDWWPCKADMQDKIDSMDISVNVPWTGADTFWVASNGKLVDSTISASRRTFTFKNRYPMASYLVCVTVARFNRYYRSATIGGTTVPVVYNLFRGKTAATYNNILNKLDVVNQVLVAFSNKFGDYPYKYEKHGFNEGLGGPTAGGMEHQTMSAIGTSDLTASSTLCHELMHQWFGDKATFATWTDLWLAEGFARYGEALAGELVPATGLVAATEMSSAKGAAQGITTVPLRIPNYTTSAAVWSTAGYISTVYDRGCMVVSMLRALSGDNNFFQACRNYLDSTSGSGYRSATADSLKNNFNRVLNYDLTPFFNDFVSGRGHPTTTVNWNTPAPNKFVVRVASQTRTAGATSTYFHNVIVLRLQDATHDTTIVFYDIDGNNLAKAGLATGIGPSVPGNLLTYNLGFTPTTVTFDPFSKTLSAGSASKLATLAIDIVNFTAQKGAAGNQVHLQLAKNEPVNKVVLLKSANGTDFTEAGVMNNVNSNDQFLNFEFTDAIPYLPATFYRAKIYTTNGEEYSSTVKVQVAAKSKITITPSPANEKATVSFANPSKEQVAVRVVNAAGKTVLETETKNNFIHIDVSNLSSGMYMLQVIKQDQVADTNKFLVRH